MADWMTGVMLGNMIGLEYLMGIVDVESTGREKAGLSVAYVSQETASAGTVERISTSVTPAPTTYRTGVVFIPSTSGSGAGGGGCYPV